MSAADIKFARDYGLSPGSPLWLVYSEEHPYSHKVYESFATGEEAHAHAAQLATAMPGKDFHVLATISVVSTSREVVGQRYDPTRPPKLPDPPEFAEVDEAALSAPVPPIAVAPPDDEPF